MTTTEKTLADLKPAVTELAEKMTKQISVKKSGDVEIAENLFESTLPEGMTMDTVTAVRQHTANFIAAGQYTFGRAAVDAMSKNKDLNEVSASVSLGCKDTVEYSVERSHTYMDRMGANKDNPREIVKHGVCTATITMQGTAGSSGQLGLARKHVGAYAAQLLSK